MSFFAVFMCVFSLLGALDRALGNRFGLGKEFEKGFHFLGIMVLSMVGMIVISPVIADLLAPVFSGMYRTLGLDPSIIPASLFANDMGGASLATQVAVDEKLGLFIGLVVSTMMGSTVSYNIPVGMGMVTAERHKDMFTGMLCGIVTIPIGCLAAGLFVAIPIAALLWNLLPLVIFSAVVVCGLLLAPKLSVKIFAGVGKVIHILITFGLAVALLKYLTGVEWIAGLPTYEEAALICVNASAVISGAFPFIFLVSKLLTKPARILGNKLGISDISAIGLVGTLATNATTYERMNHMDSKGVVLNAAFSVSASFTFAGHLAFTMAFDETYILPMIIGKLAAGLAAFILALMLYDRKNA